MKVLSLPYDDRPREKLLRLGAPSLSDSELLALILGSGTRGLNVIELSRDILTRFGGLKGLSKVGFSTLLSVKGVGKAKAAVLSALAELLSREMEVDETMEIDATLGDLQGSIRAVEEAYLLCIDGKTEVTALRLLSRGNEEGLILDVMETLRQAMSLPSRGFLLVHTHPSGSPFPSKADLEFTDELTRQASSLGLRFYDHVILTKEGRFSFRENGILAESSPVL